MLHMSFLCAYQMQHLPNTAPTLNLSHNIPYNASHNISHNTSHTGGPAARSQPVCATPSALLHPICHPATPPPPLHHHHQYPSQHHHHPTHTCTPTHSPAATTTSTHSTITQPHKTALLHKTAPPAQPHKTVVPARPQAVIAMLTARKTDTLQHKALHRMHTPAQPRHSACRAMGWLQAFLWRGLLPIVLVHQRKGWVPSVLVHQRKGCSRRR